MGYELHITRRAEWSDYDGPAITLQEWQAYVESDAEIEHDPDNEPIHFLFTAHPEEPWPLLWYRGEICAKDPDEPTIRKLVEVAKTLNARAVGDEGEEYT